MSLSGTGGITPFVKSEGYRGDGEVSVVERYVEKVSGELKDCFSRTIDGSLPTTADLVSFASHLFSYSTFRSCVNFHQAKIPIDRSLDLAIAEGARICASGRTSDAMISLDETIPMEGFSTFMGLVRLNRITTNTDGHVVVGNGNRLFSLLPRDINDLTVGGFLAPFFPRGVVEPVPISRLADLELPRKGTTGPIGDIVKKINLISFDAATAAAGVHLYAGFQGARKFFTTNDNDLSWILGNSSVDWPAFSLPGGTADLKLQNHPKTASLIAEVKNLSLKADLPLCFGAEPVELSGDITTTIPHGLGTISVHLDQSALTIPNFPSFGRRLGSFSGTVTGDLTFHLDPKTKAPVLGEIEVTVDDVVFKVGEGDQALSVEGDLFLRYGPEGLDLDFDGDVMAKSDGINLSFPLELKADPQTGFRWLARIMGEKGGRQSVGPVTVEEGEIEVTGNGFEDVWVATKKPLAIGWGGKIFAKNISVSGLLKEGWGSLKVDLPAILEGGRGSAILQGPTSRWISGRGLNGHYSLSLPTMNQGGDYPMTNLEAGGNFRTPSYFGFWKKPSLEVAGGRVTASVVKTAVTLHHAGTIGWDRKLRSLLVVLDPTESEIRTGGGVVDYEGRRFTVAGLTGKIGGELALTPLKKGGFWPSGNNIGLTRGKLLPLFSDLTLFAERLHGVVGETIYGRGIDNFVKVNLCLTGLNTPSEGCEMMLGQRGMKFLPLSGPSHWKIIRRFLGGIQ